MKPVAAAESAGAAPRAGAKSSVSRHVRTVLTLDQAGLGGALVLLVVLFALSTPYFFTVENGLNITRAVSYTGIAAAIATLVLIGGGVDLSVAAVMALAGTAAAGMMDAGLPWWLAVLGGLATGGVVGLLNAWLITTVGINALIATIGTQFAIRGFAYIVVNSREVLIRDDAFLFLGQGDVFGMPAPAVLMVLAFVAVGVAMRFTAFGQHVLAIGGSPNGNMARLAGVAVERRQYQMYIASGVVSAFAGIVLASYSGTGLGYAASGAELPIIAAVILGGTALGGGRGSVIGTLLGVLVIGVVNNGLTLRNVSFVWLFVVQGIALLLAVLIDERRQRREAR